MDKKEIMQAAYFGLADTADQRFPSGHLWYFKDVPAPRFDPNKAKALLKEAGYKGETLELMGNRGEVADIEGAAIQAQLKRVGVKVELKILERASALEMRGARVNTCSSSPAAPITRTRCRLTRNMPASRTRKIAGSTKAVIAIKNMMRC